MTKTATWQIPYPALSDPADIQGVDAIDDLAIRVDACLTILKTQGAIPGEIKLWPGATLPAQATYGHWVWCDGAIFSATTYPIAAANIAAAWKTAFGLADPGAGNFRVPDLRGVIPCGLDAMPGGSRANRITRAAAITTAILSGSEYVTLALAAIPSHAHAGATGGQSADHTHTLTTGTESADHSHVVANHYHGGNTGYVSNDHAHNVTTAHGGANTSTAGGGVGVPDTTNLTVATSGFTANHYHAVNAEAPGTGGRSAAHTHSGTSSGVSTGHTHSIPAEGGGGSHENLPPTVFVPYICKLDD
jgi:microcystin-dependent protein